MSIEDVKTALKVIQWVSEEDGNYFSQKIEQAPLTDSGMKLVDLYEKNSIERSEKFDFVADVLRRIIVEGIE